MKSKKPYLLRAVHEWIIDNGMTPHIMVDATQPEVCVVEEFIQNGKIVLNIDHDAVDNLCLDDDSVSFTAYFGASNQAKQMFVPMSAITAIFAQEIADGITFEPEAQNSLTKRIGSAARKKILQKVAVKRSKKQTESNEKQAKDAKKPDLKIVK